MYVLLEHAMPGERLASRSDAVLVVLQELRGGWGALGLVLRMLPVWLRNWAYNFVARNRYRIFGKYDACPIPAERDRCKFLDLQ
jgi:predicted DCC family thiol-disulfide oxidoreductase YuxK